MQLTKGNSLYIYLPSLLSGLVLVAAFPTPDLWPLAWIAIVPFLISLYRLDTSRSFTAGLIFGLCFFFGTEYWVYHSINHYGGLNLISSLIIVLLLCAYQSLYTALFGLLFSKAIKATDLPVTFIAVPLWVALEYLRGYLFTGFPWSLLGYSQHSLLPVIQISDITGVYGVSFLVILGNSFIADLFLVGKRRADKPLFPTWTTVVSSIATIIIIFAAFSYGLYKLKSFDDDDRSTRKVNIAVIQGNIDQAVKWNPEYRAKVINKYKRLTEEVVQKGVEMVIWPETALPFFFGKDRAETEDLSAFVKERDLSLLTGGVLLKKKAPVNNSNYPRKNAFDLANSAILINSDGNTPYIYDKIHLVPFGEYVPLKSILFFIDKLVTGIGEFRAGKVFTQARTAWGEFSTLICYEAIFPGLVRKFYRDGGDLIINITNDAWFGRTTGPYQHFIISAFRAVENRRPLIRAANTGISGFIDAAGRIQKRTELFSEKIIRGSIGIKSNPGRTFYTAYGDIFSLLNILVTVLFFSLKPEVFK